MADPRTGKAAHMPAEQLSDTNPTTIDQQSLLQLLDLHATRMGATIGEVIAEKLAGLSPRGGDAQTGPLPGGSREIPERITLALERAEEAWRAKYPADDRAHLRSTDQKLRDLEKTLAGPQKLLEEEPGDTRPPVGKSGAWRLPDYQAVPPDPTTAENCESAPPSGSA
jgi:hypothetical protein